MEEEEGRQEAPPPRGRDDAEEEQVVGDEREPGADGGDLHAVLEERDRERPPGTGNNICSVCHEPWASSGAHRICCIPCGHVYGRSCLELWLARSRSRARGTPAAAKCLWCGQEFRREDIINLYGATEHLLQQQQQQMPKPLGGSFSHIDHEPTLHLPCDLTEDISFLQDKFGSEVANKTYNLLKSDIANTHIALQRENSKLFRGIGEIFKKTLCSEGQREGDVAEKIDSRAVECDNGDAHIVDRDIIGRHISSQE